MSTNQIIHLLRVPLGVVHGVEDLSRSLSYVRKGATGMRQDELDVRVLMLGTRGNQVKCALARLMCVIDDGLIHERVGPSCVMWVNWMNKDYGFSLVQLVPDLVELGVAEVVVAFVSCEDSDTIGVEGIKSILDFLQAGLLVQEVWQACKEANVVGVLVTDLGSVVIGVAGHFRRIFGDLSPGRCQRDN